MKNYWIAFIVFVTIALLGLSTIIYKCFIQRPEAETPHLYYLNTDSMKEAGNGVVDSVWGPSIKAVYLCNKKNAPGDSTPWADVYVCRSYNKVDSLSGDTLVVFLDTQPTGDFRVGYDIQEHEAGIKPTAKYGKCRTMIPPNLIDSLKHYHYKYGKVYDEFAAD